MPTYSYIPPEYDTKSKTPAISSRTPSVPKQATTRVDKKPRIPYRDTGAAGKSIFGQATSWKYKPLPPLPHERSDQSPSKPLLSKLKEHDWDTVSLVKHSSESAEIHAQHGKVTKAAKNDSKKLTSAASE